MNNEMYGISVEVAIAEEFDVPINKDYASRADYDVVDNIRPIVARAFDDFQLPYPVEHVAEGQNPVDFILEGYDEFGEPNTLSVKSNFRELGKASPQVIGQPTDMTWYEHFEDLAGGIADADEYYDMDYHERGQVFKRCVFEHTAEMMSRYFQHIFECTYLLVCYNIDQDAGAYAEAFVCGKYSNPVWYDEDFSFTQSLESWNESCTVKYCGVSIGEFQVHNNRNCFKFRFDVNKLSELIEDGTIQFDYE